MKLLLVLFVALPVRGQLGGGDARDLVYIATPVPMPCDPSERWMPGCPPAELQGIAVQVVSARSVKFHVAVTYTTSEGEERSAAITFIPDAGKADTRVFRIGRVRFRHLPGITINELRIEREGYEPIVRTKG